MRLVKNNQVVIPSGITNQFVAKCFAANGGASAAGISTFPAFNYNSPELRSLWDIAPEQNQCVA